MIIWKPQTFENNIVYGFLLYSVVSPFFNIVRLLLSTVFLVNPIEKNLNEVRSGTLGDHLMIPRFPIHIFVKTGSRYL